MKGISHWVYGSVLTVGLAVVHAQEPDWASMSYTTHAAYQVVDANGNGTLPHGYVHRALSDDD